MSDFLVYSRVDVKIDGVINARQKIGDDNRHPKNIHSNLLSNNTISKPWHHYIWICTLQSYHYDVLLKP